MKTIADPDLAVKSIMIRIRFDPRTWPITAFVNNSALLSFFLRKMYVIEDENNIAGSITNIMPRR
jgi:hypothetical protein